MERRAKLTFPFATAGFAVSELENANWYFRRSVRLIIEHIVFGPNQSTQCGMAPLYASQSRPQLA
jgi:hypothetical protein